MSSRASTGSAFRRSLDVRRPSFSRKYRWTRFPDQRAQSFTVHDMTLEELAELIRSTSASAKAALPWLKFAAFGDRRSGLNCLRSNANVLSISGVEGDYDGEEIRLVTTIRTLRAAKVESLVYTSPSHTPKAPRWRVIAPTSVRLPPERRLPLLARLNGVLGGVFAAESFTLSQSFYYGSVRGNGAPQTAIVHGDCIDTRHDLDAGAIVHKYAARGCGRKPDQALVADSIDMVAAAVAVIPNDFPDDPRSPAWLPWKRFGMAVWAATAGSDEGYEIFDGFSRRWEFGAYDAHLTQRCWAEITVTPPNNIGAGTIFYMADQASPGWRDKFEEQQWVKIAEMMRA